MIILGLDPGVARIGFGVINTSKKEQFVRCGCITTPENMNIEDRLEMLAKDLEDIKKEEKPDISIVESIFFGNNKKTAIITAQARGVILYILRIHNITIESLTPLQIKSRLTGYGAAKKQQIQTVVQQQLHLSSPPQPDDAADALAAALCYT